MRGKEKLLNQIIEGTAITQCTSPLLPAVRCFLSYEALSRGALSALRVLIQLKTSGEGNRWVTGQRNTPIPARDKIKWTQHAQDRHQVPWLKRSVHPSSSWLSLASYKYPCDIVVKCGSCAPPLAGFPDIAGLLLAYKGLLSSEIT